MSDVIQDNMRTLRKFGVFITGASQNLQEYGEEMGSEVQELADTLISFKCGEETARQISASFPTLGKSEKKEPWNAIVNLPYYKFYVSTPVGGVTEVRLAETVDLGRGPHSWKTVARASLDEHGDSVRSRKDKGSIPTPEISSRQSTSHFLHSPRSERKRSLRVGSG